MLCGQTFTITGGAESYESRGIIPRTLSHLFDLLSSPAVTSSTTQYAVRISYLEIYNEAGHDLLDPSADLSSLSQLPRVTLQEDASSTLHLHGLGSYPVHAVEDALELLFRGDTNRMICETPSNDASSRSHCVFTITLEARDPSTSTVRRSKLHLVDLAGSERVKKTQVTGRLFREAAFINLSLHHLEQVILALHERAQGKAVHVPYRNSMMTSVLRDSLGGNCRTYMIATMSGEPGHVDESVSTARFAGRVGRIRNEVWVEEEEDVEGTVRRLRGQVKELKEEVRRLRGEEGVGRAEVMTAEEVDACKEVVRRYVRREEGGEDDFSLGNEERVRTYLRLLRQMTRGTKPAAEMATMEAEVGRLTAALEEKDAEIARLTRALEQRSASPAIASAASPSSAASALPSPMSHPVVESDRPDTAAASFEAFRASYAAHAGLEARKAELRTLITAAKALGEGINRSREVINGRKQRLQARRVQREMAADAEQSAEEDAEEARLRSEVEEEKRRYREQFDALKQRKDAIEHLKATIERSRRRMQADYELWKAQQSSEPPTPRLEERGRPAAPEEKEMFESRAVPAQSAQAITGRGSLSRMMLGGVGAASAALNATTSAFTTQRPAAAAAAASTEADADAIAAAVTAAGRVVRTGNAQADADIQRFQALRAQLLQQAAAIQGAVK